MKKRIIEKLNSINFDYINNNYIASFKDLTEDEVLIIQLPDFTIKCNDIEFVVIYVQEISMKIEDYPLYIHNNENILDARRYYDAELILTKSTKQLRNEQLETLDI